jgi:uncharacterized protein
MSQEVMPMSIVVETQEPVVTIKMLPAFLFVAFGLAWGILALFIFNQEQMTAAFGPISGRHPLFILSVYSPAIAAFGLVLYSGGFVGLKRFLTRLLLWRCSANSYAFLLLGIPLIYVAGSAVKGNLLENPFTLVLGPVEEIGWRGVALPLLQRHLSPLWAGLILGLIWGIWHLPAFFLSGTPQSAWGFTPFFIGSVAISLILTPLFNSSRGSILLPALYHFQLNNPLWPDAQPYDTVFFVLAAIIVVWLNRETMFKRDGAVIDVIPALHDNFVQVSNLHGQIDGTTGRPAR